MEEPTFVEIDPPSLQVNQPIPPEKFTIDFPVGSVIYDGFLDKPFRVTDQGNEYFDPRKKIDSVNSSSMFNLMLVVAVNLAALLLLIAWRVFDQLKRRRQA